MKTRFLIFGIFFLLLITPLAAQTDTSVKTKDTAIQRSRKIHFVGYEIEGNDTMYLYLLNRFKKVGSIKTKEEIEYYAKLTRWVSHALPYAKLAAYRLQIMEDNLKLLKTEKERKKYIKECEKAIKKQFMDDLKNLYVEEGRILLKLIHRETGKTTFEIMKNYGGTFDTIFYQAIAKTYDADMKVTFDPVLDYQIEEIIKDLESVK